MEPRAAERAERVPTAVPSWPAAPPAAVRLTARAARLEGATAVAEASRGQVSVRIGIWVDDRGAVRQARWRANDDRGGVAACADAACALLESGAEGAAHDEEVLARAAPGAGSRAALVAHAVRAALALR